MRGFVTGHVDEFSNHMWCVVRYDPGPVMARKLSSALTYPPRQRLDVDAGEVFITILMIGTREECQDEAARLGGATPWARRVIQCDDGRTWPTQQQAARALGVHQPAVSMALRGLSATVAGHVIRYVDET